MSISAVRGLAGTPDFAGVIARRLQKIYKAGFHEALVNRILALRLHNFDSWPELSNGDVLLIAYGNSICTENEIPLRTLHSFMKENLSGIINGIHILPFFPYTSDDGFAVSDFMNVNPALGSWDDIAAIGTDYYIMTDLVINHVSSAHPWFKNYLQNIAPGKGFFIEAEADADYSLVIRPRSSSLFTRFNTINGERDVWTTFSSDQADLNFANPDVLLEMLKVLVFYISRGARFIRLDAIAFLWKCSGTYCLHLEETHEIVRLIHDVATFIRPGTLILTETNVPNKENWSYFGNGDEAHLVYQFSLPPLLLYTLFSGNAFFLNQWAKQIPDTMPGQTFLNYTASHDGIGVRPLEGLLPESELNSLIKGMSESGGFLSMRSGNNGSLYPYELNISWFDAMKRTANGLDNLHESRYICSQTMMMALKGVPAFYIHSLLATPNDYEGVKNSGRYRSINRKVLKKEEINKLLNTDSVQGRIFNRLIKLIRIRNITSAFHPDCEQEMLDLGNTIFGFTRRNYATGHVVHCISNITSETVRANHVANKGKNTYDLIAEEFLTSNDLIALKPYQTRWIEEKE